jgi:aspartyl-tRNA(Asn)/glutamyl-tRNA(Gln) amidotransferase subunit B
MIHAGGDSGRISGSAGSVVDFNRVGTPLLEIVTEPDIRSPEDARRFLTLLRATVVAIGASECDMEKGSLRADANVSIRPIGSSEYGTKTELKNMNSFRFLERGIEAEIARQKEIIASGGQVTQETVHYEPETGHITSLRSKEESHDYRYFPEPDLVPVAPDPAWVDELQAGLPELPIPLRRRLVDEMGLSAEDAEVITESPALVAYYMEAAGQADPKACANWIRGELRAQLRDSGQEPWESNVTPAHIAELVGLLESNTVSVPAAKEVLAGVIATGDSPAAVVEAKGLGQISDEGELAAIIKSIVDANPEQAQQLREGKDKVIGFFVGQAMKQTGGRADPQAVQRLVRDAVLG